MHFSLLSSIALGAGMTNVGFLAAVAVLACILGAEIAGICILISKMVRARRARRQQEEEDAAMDRSASYHHHALGFLLAFGAIPQTTYLALTVLAALTALAAVVFVVLLIVFRACGYDFAAMGAGREERKSEPVSDEPSEELTYAALLEQMPDESEEQRQEAYTEADEQYVAQEEPFAAFDEEPTVIEGEQEEPAVIVQEAPVGMEPVVQQSTVTASQEPAFADGTRPYKVVEKVVTETYKEVVKETPVSGESKQSGLSDAVVEKLVDLLDYEIRSRRESERNDADKADKTEKHKDGSVATFAESELPDDEDIEDEDDENEDDDDLDEGVDGKREDDEDRDDEENDTDGDHFTGNERIIGFDEETGCYIVAHYRKSFEAKLIQARPNIKKYYSDLKNALLSYKGTKNRISWTADSFHNGRTPIAKINVKTRILELYLALDPASLEGTVYRGQDVGNKKKYADTPFRYKLRTPRKFKWALELIQRTCEEHGLSPIDIEHVDYEAQYPFDTTDNLVARKLIKEYIREEKPATTFELAPDHVPSVPDEDESVIPANANFSWEFDNERMAEPEPEPTPEVEPEVEPEPIPEPEVIPEPTPAPAQTATVTRETVKVTEMRYTERYYADSQPTYEQVITTTEPIEALAVPAEETAEEVAEETAEEPIATETYAPIAVEEVLESDESETDTEEWQNGDEEADEELFFEEGATEIVYDDAEEETVAEAEENADALPFRPSYYANRNYYEDEETPAVAEETVYEEADEGEYETEEAEAVEEEEVYENEPVTEPTPAPKRNINPAVAVVDICSLEEHFDAGDVIDLETLKARDLVLPSATVLKIYASGEITKSFTVEANHFTLDAIKAISDADGDSVMVR